MARELHIDVTQPDGRRVRVDVSVLPIIGVRRKIRREGGPAPASIVFAIDDDELADAATLRAFLADITSDQSSGAVVRAACWEPDASVLLRLLGVTGPPPSVISLKLPST